MQQQTGMPQLKLAHVELKTDSSILGVVRDGAPTISRLLTFDLRLGCVLTSASTRVPAGGQLQPSWERGQNADQEARSGRVWASRVQE